MNPNLKPIGTGSPVAGRVLNKIIRPGSLSAPKGFAAIPESRAREIQRQGGLSHTKAHMRRLAKASVQSRKAL